MGIIKDGSVSGTLPTTSSNSEVFSVHYPAYPSSMERAVETLGGSQGIGKARKSKSNKLELHFRPEDPYSHPAFGELQPCNNFLLRISKKKVSNKEKSENSSNLLSAEPLISEQKDLCPEQTEITEEPTINSSPCKETESQLEEELCADIVAHVTETYHFNGMVDYQHVLAVHAGVARGKKRNWAEVEPQFEKGGIMDVDQEDLLILVPPLFSPKDMPENVALKPSVDLSLKKKQEGIVQHRWEMEIEPSLAIDFNIKEVPKPVDWEKYIPQGSEHWEWQKAVSDLFDEQPIWVKDSLIERLLKKNLKFGGHMLRRLLFRIAYYFSNGPFLRFWIRKGYDPRTDPESRIYQRIDFRVPPSLRSYCDANVGSGVKHKWADICAFKVFPYKCQVSMQLCALEDDYIKQEIKKPTKQETCSLGTGWFSSHTLESLRLCIAVRFLSIYPKTGAQSILKYVSIRFEKSKKIRISPKVSKLNAQGQPINKETVDNEDKGGADEDVEEQEDEEDEEEEEEDEEEEELEDENIEEDAYEVDMGGDDGNNFVQQSNYSEDISRSFLQELFDSFPCNNNEAAANNDGEYEIFSDANNSDDDDY